MNTITAHWAIALTEVIVGASKTARKASGNHAPITPGPSSMPVMICTTTSCAKCSVRPSRQDS
jgi:hypothetical protein